MAQVAGARICGGERNWAACSSWSVRAGSGSVGAVTPSNQGGLVWIIVDPKEQQACTQSLEMIGIERWKNMAGGKRAGRDTGTPEHTAQHKDK